MCLVLRVTCVHHVAFDVVYVSLGIHVSYDMGDKGSIGYHLAPKLDE